MQETRSNEAYAFAGLYSVNRSYTPNGLNQYASVAGTSFGYDANGNLTCDGAAIFLYDGENHLVEKRAMVGSSCTATTGTLLASLRYDPLGRLYEISSPSSGLTRFVHDGDAMIGEYGSTGTLLRRHAHGPAVGADDPVMSFEGATMAASARRFLLTDQQGSIVAATGNGGVALRLFRYDEYGIPQASDGAALTPANAARFLYTGQAFLPEVGLYYYKARLYSPTLGRFMQTDPIGYDDGINWYAYVANDPVNRSDPTGLCTENTCPVSAIWGSTEYNLQVRQTEEKAGAVGAPILAAILLSPLAYVAIDSAAISVGARGFQASRASLQTAERLPTNGLRQTMTGAIDKIRNIVVNNGTRGDFVGAARESRGIKTGFDHVTEMKGSIKGLSDALRSIQGSLRNPNLSTEARATLNAWKDTAQTTLQAMRKTLNY